MSFFQRESEAIVIHIYLLLYIRVNLSLSPYYCNWTNLGFMGLSVDNEYISNIGGTHVSDTSDLWY